MQERIQPHSQDAEEAVLGSCLTSQEAIDVTSEQLKTKHFYFPEHRKIYDAIIALSNDSIPADIVTVSNYLEKNGMLEDCGGRPYITNLAHFSCFSGNINYYIKPVLDNAILREIISVHIETIDMCYRQEGEADEILDKAEQRIFDISDHNLKKNEAVTYADIASGIIEDYEYRRGLGGRMPGRTTGYSDLDKILGGLRRKKLYVLAARPSMGKSALAVNILDNICMDADTAAYFFSIEMDASEVGSRSLFGGAGVNVKDAQEGRLADHDADKVVRQIEPFTKRNVIIDESPTLTIPQIRATLRRAFTKYPIKVVCVDYLQLMDAPGENRNLQISYISRNLKAIAKEFDVPVIVISQLNRSVDQRENKRPQLSDLRDSGAIEQDADVVMFIYNEDMYLRHLDYKDERREKARGNGVEIGISKQRGGPTGLVKLMYRAEQVRFENMYRE